jgi:hypothetical protein
LGPYSLWRRLEKATHLCLDFSRALRGQQRGGRGHVLTADPFEERRAAGLLRPLHGSGDGRLADAGGLCRECEAALLDDELKV